MQDLPMLAALRADEDMQRAVSAGRWGGMALGAGAGLLVAPRRWGLVYAAAGAVGGALLGGALGGVAAAAGNPAGAVVSAVL